MAHTLPLALASLLGSPLLAQASWTRIYPALSPPARSDAAMASHDASGSVLLLFGINGSPVTDVWRLQGTTWSPVTGTLPPWRQGTQMAYDSGRQRIVLFGGSGARGDLQDTWEWNGTAWSNPDPAVRPPARHFSALAFDPVRGVTVLFGGYSTNGYMQDTWEWNGVSWTQRFPVVVPAARELALMAFDPVSRSVLLHGGIGTPTGQALPYDDTWTWNGSIWQQRFPSTPPPYRLNAAMVSDRDRQRVVLLGGAFADPRTWQWDGGQWSADLDPSPAPRHRFAMAYDGAARRVVVHGGIVGVASSGFVVDDTWTYQTPLPADVVSFGVGCSGTAGVPQLANAPYELPWLGDSVHHVVGNLALGSLGAVFVSSFSQIAPLSLAAIGMPGCDLLVSLDVVEFGPAAGGMAEWALVIPISTALAGVPFYQQAFALDAGTNALGLAASNGIVVTPGIR